MQAQLDRFGRGIDSFLTEERLRRLLLLAQIAVTLAQFARLVIALCQTLGIG